MRGVLDAAAARGYPIKVVLFANENDTGGEPEPLENTQGYVTSVSDELEAIKPLRAPVLVVTPHAYGIGGKQPRGEARTPTQITPPLATQLTRNLPLAEKAEGNALARTAMVAVRRLAAAGGHPLPERIPPAEHNPEGILGAASQRDEDLLREPWFIAVVLGGTALLLGALLVGIQRRGRREPDTAAPMPPERSA